MRNPSRTRLEYIIYGSGMTTSTVCMGLACIFGFDEEGKRRKLVMDQPFDESLREARLELKEYQDKKAMQFENWMYRKGYGDFWKKWFGKKQIGNQPQPQQQQPTSYLEGLEDDKKR